MRFLILISLLSLVACKTENKIVGKNTPPAPAVEEAEKTTKSVNLIEESPQLVLPHAPHASTLRKKLLLQLIESKFKTNEVTKISEQDEFKFSDTSDIRKQLNLTQFQKMSETQTRVIVSYAQNANAYLVPTNVPVTSIIEKLKIQPEGERTLVWMSSKEGVTREGQVIYLLSVNHEDLMEVDRMTYSEIVNVDTKTTAHQLKLKYGQIAEVQMQFDYFVQQLQVQNLSGKGLKCTPETMEAGSCGSCSYKKEVPSSQFKSQPIDSLNELNFDVTLGGRKIEINDLSPVFDKKQLMMIINANSFTHDEELSLQFLMNPRSFSVVTNGFDYEYTCTNKGVSKAEILQSRAQSDFKVKVFGRGSALKKIELK